jgi:hypothetical protein
VPIPPGHEIKLSTILQGLPPEPGLYAITGRHDVHAGGGVLYIGQAERLDQRVLASSEAHLFETHEEQVERYLRMTADVWELTVRWARLSANLLYAVERLLISGARTKGPLEDEKDLVVMSAGRKGPLLPIVAGAYQCSWTDMKNRPPGP